MICFIILLKQDFDPNEYLNFYKIGIGPVYLENNPFYNRALPGLNRCDNSSFSLNQTYRLFRRYTNIQFNLFELNNDEFSHIHCITHFHEKDEKRWRMTMRYNAFIRFYFNEKIIHSPYFSYENNKTRICDHYLIIIKISNQSNEISYPKVKVDPIHFINLVTNEDKIFKFTLKFTNSDDIFNQNEGIDLSNAYTDESLSIFYFLSAFIVVFAILFCYFYFNWKYRKVQLILNEIWHLPKNFRKILLFSSPSLLCVLFIPLFYLITIFSQKYFPNQNLDFLSIFTKSVFICFIPEIFLHFHIIRFQKMEYYKYYVYFPVFVFFVLYIFPIQIFNILLNLFHKTFIGNTSFDLCISIFWAIFSLWFRNRIFYFFKQLRFYTSFQPQKGSSLIRSRQKKIWTIIDIFYVIIITFHLISITNNFYSYFYHDQQINYSDTFAMIVLYTAFAIFYGLIRTLFRLDCQASSWQEGFQRIYLCLGSLVAFYSLFIGFQECGFKGMSKFVYICLFGYSVFLFATLLGFGASYYASFLFVRLISQSQEYDLL